MIVVAAVAGCGARAHGEPVLAAAPTKASAAVSGCPPNDGLPHVVGKLRPWVDPGPSGATVLWLPGANSKRCESVITHIDSAHAQHFAAAVEAVAPFPPGTYDCPADDGRAATVFLSYAGRVKAEVIQLYLSGCGGVTAPDRAVMQGVGLKQLGGIPKGM